MGEVLPSIPPFGSQIPWSQTLKFLRSSNRSLARFHADDRSSVRTYTGGLVRCSSTANTVQLLPHYLPPYRKAGKFL